jgi:hypothetical protein
MTHFLGIGNATGNEAHFWAESAFLLMFLRIFGGWEEMEKTAPREGTRPTNRNDGDRRFWLVPKGRR